MRKFYLFLTGALVSLFSLQTIAQVNPDSCSADFEKLQTNSNYPLHVYYRALPWHSSGKKPVQICWNFGDNHDTCIQYLTSYTGAYAVFHQYAQPGSYTVCVNILYDGGCEAHLCKTVQAGDASTCTADFERIPTLANDPLHVY